MIVEVRLFADFRKGRFNERELELPAASCLSDLLQHLKIDPLVEGYHGWEDHGWAVDHARRHQHTEIVEILENHMWEKDSMDCDD